MLCLTSCNRKSALFTGAPRPEQKAEQKDSRIISVKTGPAQKKPKDSANAFAEKTDGDNMFGEKSKRMKRKQAAREEKKKQGNAFSEKTDGKEVFGEKGRAKKKKKKWWKIFKFRSSEERQIKKESRKLFQRSKQKEDKARRKKMRHREEGLFPKGVIN